MRTPAIFMTALMATGLVTAQSHRVCAAAIGRSAHVFGQYFHALQQEPLNPVERLVFSLVLAHDRAQRDCKTPLHS
ncbi:MAG: hypothetical protein ABSC93_14325 [Bryobacteraceae bacterium]|jgi:hypothetical protein